MQGLEGGQRAVRLGQGSAQGSDTDVFIYRRGLRGAPLQALDSSPATALQAGQDNKSSNEDDLPGI